MLRSKVQNKGAKEWGDVDEEEKEVEVEGWSSGGGRSE